MTYKWIGWCRQDHHDKVWILIQISGDQHSGRFVTVWGRRGKKLQSKIQDYMTARERDSLVNSKVSKGYEHIQEQDLNLIYPEFQMDLEKTTVWALLSA